MAVALHTFVSEDAYYKVLKAFAAGAYDLKKELVLAKLRTELNITDQRHAALRKMIEDGQELQLSQYESAADRQAEPQHKRKREQYHNDGYAYDDSSAVRAGSLQAPESPFVTARGGPSSGAKQQKRQKREGSLANPEGPVLPPQVADINELIGYKIQRYWPENGGWFEGAITDYRPATGEHCIVYDMNTTSESYEWFNMSRASRKEYRLLDQKINIIEHAPKAGPSSQPPHRQQQPPPRKPGAPGGRGFGPGGGRGRGRGERILPSQMNGRKGQDYEQASYRAPSGRPNGAAARAAFVVESDDESLSDDSLSD